MAILLTENCIGCGACESACLPGCIALKSDPDGFARAYISEDGCTGCGRCKIVCPQLRSVRARPKEVFAYQNPNPEELFRAQSGGAFPVLARAVIEQGGVVFGVRWTGSCEDVEFVGFETLAELPSLSGSKYVAANLAPVIPNIKSAVKTGRKVLFSGLPCQVAAIRNLLPHRDNLLLVEVLCRGPMSPAVWHELHKKMPSDLDSFLFRDKTLQGWGPQGEKVSYQFSDGTKQFFSPKRLPVWKIFISSVANSSSCLNCKFRSMNRAADITLGDFWGIEKLMALPDDVRKRGVSIVHVQTQLGERFLQVLRPGILGRFSDLEKIESLNGGYQPFPESDKRRQRSFAACQRLLGLRAAVWLASMYAHCGRYFTKRFAGKQQEG